MAESDAVSTMHGLIARLNLTTPLVCIQSTRGAVAPTPRVGSINTDIDIMDFLNGHDDILGFLYILAVPGTLIHNPQYVALWQRDAIAAHLRPTTAPNIQHTPSEDEYYRKGWDALQAYRAVTQKAIGHFILCTYDMQTIYISPLLLYTITKTIVRRKGCHIIGAIPSQFLHTEQLAFKVTSYILTTTIAIYDAFTDLSARQLNLVETISVSTQLHNAETISAARKTQTSTSSHRLAPPTSGPSTPASSSLIRTAKGATIAPRASAESRLPDRADYPIPPATIAAATLAAVQHMRYSETLVGKQISEFVDSMCRSNGGLRESNVPQWELPRDLQDYITQMSRLIAHSISLDAGLAGVHRYVSPLFKEHAQKQLMLASNAVLDIIKKIDGQTGTNPKRARISRLPIP